MKTKITDTPRTDEAEFNTHIKIDYEWLVPAGLARELERENAQMKRVVGLARDAVESGAVDECYLSLLRDAVSALPNAQVQRRPAPEPSTTCDDHGRSL